MASRYLGIRAYARHRGVSHVAVLKAIRTGRISLTKSGKINVAKADADWDANTAPYSRSRKPETDSDRPDSRAAYAVSRAVREQFEAKLAKLEFEERSGKLIDRMLVESTWFEKGRLIRDGILNIPDRLSQLLASINEPRKIHQLLDSELRKALNSVADDIHRTVQ